MVEVQIAAGLCHSVKHVLATRTRIRTEAILCWRSYTLLVLDWIPLNHPKPTRIMARHVCRINGQSLLCASLCDQIFVIAELLKAIPWSSGVADNQPNLAESGRLSYSLARDPAA